jgi:hypothetical protein
MGLIRSASRTIPRGRYMRKAQVYSLIALLLSIPVMLFIAYYVTESQNIKYSSLEKVLADQIHEVEKSVENDYVQAMSISGKRAFLAASDFVISNGTYLDDSSQRMEELMADGTLYGAEVMIMHNNTLPEWADKIQNMDIGFNVEVSYSNPAVTDGEGLDALLTTDLVINVSDRFGVGSIEKDVEKEAVISLIGLEDPIFPKNTLGFVSRPFELYPYPYHAIEMASGSGFGNCEGEITFDPLYSGPDKAERILVTDDASGVSGFLGVVGEGPGVPAVSCHLVNTGPGAIDFVNRTTEASGYYLANIDNESGGLWSLPVREAITEHYYSYFPDGGGPGIMKRLEGDLSWTPTNGFETFVDASELQDFGFAVKPSQVSIAYLYFSDETINGQPVRGLPDTFRINAGNAARYNLTELM